MSELQMPLTPIGVIHTPWTTPRGAPIQPNYADGAEGTAEVFEPYAEGLADVEGFRLRVRPFLDTVERGLFATRAPCRPNPIGLSCVRLVKREGRILHLADVDMLDGTPLLDIKPYVGRFEQWSVQRSGWTDHVRGESTRSDGRFGEQP